MVIKLIAYGTGLAAILGVGAVILSLAGNSDWGVFLIAAVLVLVISLVLKK
jgi:hypothetical protein